MYQSLNNLKTSEEARSSFISEVMKHGYTHLLSSTEQGVQDTATLNSWTWKVLDTYGLLNPIVFREMLDYMQGSSNCEDSVWLKDCHFIKGGVNLENQSEWECMPDIERSKEQASIVSRTARYFCDALQNFKGCADKITLRCNVIVHCLTGNEWNIHFLEQGKITPDKFKDIIEKMSTSRECTNCVDCTYCVGCLNSEDCHYSSLLIGCKKCTYSLSLTKCADTHFSRDCTQSRNVEFSEQSWGLIYSTFCKNCKVGENLKMCMNCKSCKDCTFVISSENTTNAKLSVALNDNKQIGRANSQRRKEYDSSNNRT